MNPSKPSKRRRRVMQLAPEALETRALLTGGAGNSFAIIPGAITTANQPAVIKFTIDPTHFTVPHGKFTLGIDIATDTTNSPKLGATILGVQSSNGKAVPGTSHSVYDKGVIKTGSVTGPMTTAIVTTINTAPRGHTGPVTFSVIVAGNKGTTGKFLLGFYLPGDANGDGVVDQTDLKLVRAEMNAKSSATGSKYMFDADANRDGKINAADLMYVRKNMGVKTTISPSVTANLDAASTTGTDRVTTKSAVHFSGVVTPNATVSYADATGVVKPVTTTADATGNYSLNVSLAPGSNVFKLTTQDAFGQSVSGNLAAVVMQTNPPVTPATVAALQKASTTKS